MRSPYTKGLIDGIAIGLGYLSVSFGFGVMAVKAGLSILATVGISLTNLTSAGQAAGVTVIAAGGTLIEMLLTQLVINLRYSLMGFTLSQKLDNTFNTPRRMLVSFGITDEIFAVACAQKERLTAKYMYGLITMPVIGWSLGTLLGAAAGAVLPSYISDVLGILLYGMFIAIVVPPAKKNRHILFAVILSIGFSLLIKYVFTFISSGFAVIISAVAASVITALFFPVKEDEV
ncbi:MAG: AzlC family ABC transporter permease [Clostridia bacterium]|nr:AzlC family ABC transporter permease [Clostridia bacterium]